MPPVHIISKEKEYTIPAGISFDSAFKGSI